MRRLLLTALGLLCLGVPATWAQQALDPGAAAIVCAYNSSPPAIASGGFIFAQCDSTGKLITSSSGGGAASNITQFGGTNLSTGTGVGGAGIPRVTVSSDSSVTLGAGANTVGNVVNAPTSSSSLAVSHASATALGTSLVVKASAGNLYSYNCTALTGGGAGYCIAYNGTAAPGTGALTGSLVLDACYFGTGAGGCSLSHGILPANYSAGIVILVTSAVTPFTYTTGVDTAFISADYN
jgi:acyl-coenzyme A thioesterase PaaI-like protein